MRNPGWLLIAALVLIGGIAAVVFHDPESDQETGTYQENEPEEEGQEQADGNRSRLTGKVERAGSTGRSRPKENTTKAAPEKGERPPAVAGLDGQLELIVRDRRQQQLLRGGRYTCKASHNGKPWSTTGDIERAAAVKVAVPTDTNIDVVVETPGFVPERRRTRLTKHSKEQTLQFFLAHAAPFTGVEIRVSLARNKPAPHLAVRALHKKGDRFVELWHREKDNKDGIYRLPNLDAGSYRFECQTIDAEGLPDFNQPFDYEIEITGSDLHLKQHLCIQGGRVLLTLRENGTIAGKQVPVDLYCLDGDKPEKVACLWQALVDGKRDPDVGLSRNGLSKAAPALLHRAIAPGNYELRVARKGADPLRHELAVVSGQTTKVELQLAVR